MYPPVQCVHYLNSARSYHFFVYYYSSSLFLRQAESGTPVADVCRQMGIAEATFDLWKKKYADLGVSELRKMRQLEEENSRLKRVVADLTLDKHVLQEALRKRT